MSVNEKKIYTNGDTYFGEMKNDHKEGTGVFIRPDSLCTSASSS